MLHQQMPTTTIEITVITSITTNTVIQIATTYNCVRVINTTITTTISKASIIVIIGRHRRMRYL